MAAARRKRETIYRHRLATRVTHWINALCVLVLLMSGLQILNAHPGLYWGHYGANYDTPWLAFENGVPDWMTLPGYQDLATGRRWHFFFAWTFVINAAVFLIAGAVNGHLKRDLAPGRDDLAPRHLLAEARAHLRLKFPPMRRYNSLQKLSYLTVIFGLGPLIVLTGLTMSPGFNAFAPWLIDLFGGRQSARSLHFIAAALLVLFVIVHVAMVLLAGPRNEMRSMITGRYEIEPEDGR